LFGNYVIDAKEGELASGLDGKGRMAEPEELVETLQSFLSKESKLAGKRILITSGPTNEPIDPVRFIGNHSSGKMGKALAEACTRAGADVIFITGPVSELPFAVKELVQIETADQLLKEAKKHHKEADIVIFSAAVADYKPQKVAKEKIKKSDDELVIPLEPNPDIAQQLGDRKEKQIHIGFALETSDELENASRKLQEKKFDMIVMNSLRDTNAGFKGDQNKVTFIESNKKKKAFPLKSKVEVANDIVDYLCEELL
ncbi:MAG: bifunctional phosphopantothenoylcysteine decarboxylase/phosphopantothenate--cysteine ligase CoaBC, partial [Bacteroidota bacterium]